MSDEPFKIGYITLNGGMSKAYVDKEVSTNRWQGTNKHTDDPVEVYWTGQFWVEVKISE